MHILRLKLKELDQRIESALINQAKVQCESTRDIIAIRLVSILKLRVLVAEEISVHLFLDAIEEDLESVETYIDAYT